MPGIRFLILLLLTLQPVAVSAVPSTVPQETKRVLVVYSLDKGHPAHGLTEQGISEALQANRQFAVQFYSEYLDVGRFPAPVQSGAMADFLRSKYADIKIDVIIAVYPSAVDFLQHERSTLFPDVPIIAAEVSRNYAGMLAQSPARQRITGTIMGDNVSGLLDAVLRMKTGTRNVALVAGTAPLDTYNDQIFRDGLKLYGVKLEQINLTGLSMAETLTKVSTLPRDTIVLYSSIIRDGAGESFAPRAALIQVSRAANAPVFSLYDTYLGHGIVGGRLVSFQLQGKAAATMALRVMAGESPAAIPFGGEDAYVDHYDWRELKRWQIPTSAVPVGSEISFRKMTFWEEHRWLVIGAVSLTIIETILILGLVKNLRRRKTTEQLLRDSEQSLRDLSGRLITIQEEQRSRLARELHDDISQRLAALAIDMGMLELKVATEHPRIKDQFAAMKANIVKLADDIRIITRQLHPAILDDLGLVRAIQSESAAFSQREGIEVTFRHEHVPETIPIEISLTLYRIMQEAFRNIARHSESRSATIEVRCSDQTVHLVIKDAGRGFSPSLQQKKSGLGLVSMAERVKLVNGIFSVDSVPGEGTVINVQVPLARMES